MSDRFQLLRLIEALFFASAEPLGLDQIKRHLPEGADAEELLAELVSRYANRGVNLIRIGNRWALRTAPAGTCLSPQEKKLQLTCNACSNGL